MLRTVLSGALALSTFSVPAFAGADTHEFLNREAVERHQELRGDIAEIQREKSRGMRERREVRAETRRDMFGEPRGAQDDDRSMFGSRASRRGDAPRGGGLEGLVARYASEYGVPRDLAHGVVMVESRYRANATGKGGYIGLMQISYRTARGIGYSGSRAGLYDPATNLRYGMKYLGEAYRQAGGDYCRAVSKYQGGHGVRGVTRAGAAYCGKVRKYMAQQAPAWGRETQVAARGGERT